MIIFGLGNPLPKYKATRHNVGFMVLERMAQKLSLRFINHETYDEAVSDDFRLVKPMLYMNNSGIVVKQYLSHKDDFFIVVYDDLDLPFGKIRIRERGSDGGHQGVASIIYHLQTDNFARLRIGIGKRPANITTTDYVLSEFSVSEKSVLLKILDSAIEALMVIKQDGVKQAMNKFNPLTIIEPQINNN